MAIAYQKIVGDVRYEVRTAGGSRRLYTNGAFHSQYNPKHIFTGAAWDLLSLPSLCLAQAPKNILVLGGYRSSTGASDLRRYCRETVKAMPRKHSQHLRHRIRLLK